MVSTFGFRLQFWRVRTDEQKLFFIYFCCIGLGAKLVAALVVASVESLVEHVPRISGENRELVEPVYNTAPAERARATKPPS